MGGGEGGAGTLFSRTTLAHAVAGSIGSIVAMTLTYPLDRVRTMKQLERKSKGKGGGVFQVLKYIIEKEGWQGLYTGLSPMLVALGVSNFVYFYFFTALKATLQYFLRQRNGARKIIVNDGGAIGNLILASIAGTINVLITTPLWVAYTRVAVQRMTNNSSDKKEGAYTGVLDAIAKIAKKDGVASLWSGMGPSLILVSNPSVQFASYEWLKRALLRFKLKMDPVLKDYTHFGDIMDDQTKNVVSEAVVGPQMNSLEYLLLGAVAKMIATVVTYPLQIAQTRMRAAENSSKAKAADLGTGKDAKRVVLVKHQSSVCKYTGTIDCLQKIYGEDGFAGLYRGMEAKLLQTCLTSAFMFTAYEKICAIILRFILWKKFEK
mmetsp:Transcript_18772/g.30670  ORF Transcript_18772/g.30670 Transcript_18772/m.30670 type:complete len:377 (+) Transcript_18772:305-1435(+)|eukprot:CAMPEP_0203779142 /NCGR_PEP_ID=MMETSP0099_2-20121227/8485_1 /ASSEMBLY_ACC=CAM_ASM_000209 /TAXON_ID=96639 /ORGANISM=" , Strain NY0313808BC1" /LENGTH=376 /DNA_ID=CAMNT_0050678923 /DNA_START=275 /DNA_END=1405 /DNA_ORIENTATION=+